MRRTISPFFILFTALIGSMLLAPIPSQSQSGSAQVIVTATAGKLIAWSAAGGGVEESLQPGESTPSHPARADIRASYGLRSGC